MKKSRKWMASLLVAAMMMTVFAGCSKASETTGDKVEPTQTTAPTTAPTATPEPTEEPARDLGGIEVVIGNWWANSDDFTPSTTYEEELVAYRQEIQKKYNFTIKEKNIGGWGEIQELCSTSIMAGTPEAQVFVLDSSFAAALLSQGLFYPVNELPSFDFTQDKWNKLVTDAMTFNGKTYGFATTYEPRAGVFFNKRLFTEAGIDPNLPYDLQKDGKWDWAAFKDLCAKLTRDIDGDGTKDTYALASFEKNFYSACIYSNDAKYVGKDEKGMFYNATNEPNFLEALQFGTGLYDEGYMMPQPEGSEWNWFEAAFHDGKAAMRVAEEYIKGSLSSMEDDWGFVTFPLGTHGKTSCAYRENILVIPSCYDAETADKIAFAYNLWTNPVPGYEEEESWKLSAYSQYRDERAVDETLTMMRSGENGVLLLESYVAGLETGDICYGLGVSAATAAEKVESVQQSWGALIADANAAMNK
ncbi:extracellular solute-binding protein [Lachnoclostridium sp.]|uniref:ABC transporter substrate-binding protein n=1 Tax=Lachnoclostridium sp. TaxID=2028282 RepID=UPI00289662AA|nr:extracellular solute-binding protein [Lachnoclostridium sp.]